MATAASPIVMVPRPARIKVMARVAMSTAVVTKAPIEVSASRLRTRSRRRSMRVAPEGGVPPTQRRRGVVGAHLLGLDASVIRYSM